MIAESKLVVHWKEEFLVVRGDRGGPTCAIYCGSMSASWITLAIQLTNMSLHFIIYKRQIIPTSQHLNN